MSALKIIGKLLVDKDVKLVIVIVLVQTVNNVIPMMDSVIVHKDLVVELAINVKQTFGEILMLNAKVRMSFDGQVMFTDDEFHSRL